jgi:hypothetical protein
MARRISEGRSAAKAEWDADKCGQHFGYRLKGKAGAKRPIPMTSVRSLVARFYRLKSGYAPTGVCLKRFGHREDDKCWWWRQDGGPDAGTPLPPLQSVERPAESTGESGGKGDGLKSRQMLVTGGVGRR